MPKVICHTQYPIVTTSDYSCNRFGMAVSNHPMNYTKEQLDTEVIRQIGISLLHAICVIFAMSFVPASFVIFHIDERVSKVGLE